MKTPFNPLFPILRQLPLHIVVTCAIGGSAVYAQTTEIDPGAVPSSFTLAQGWEFNTDANLEGWAGTNAGTVTVTGGEATGTATSTDPQFSLAANLSPAIAVPRDIIVEMRVKRPAGNTNNIDLFWADVGGGLTAARSVALPGATLNDGNYHTVRVTFTGQIGVRLDRLRIDPHATNGGTFSFDYVRVYTNGGLSWDTNIALTGAQGGVGDWGTVFPTFWDGTTNVAWPATGTENAAIFDLPVDTVTVGATGVAANVLSLPTINTTQTTGYTINAAPGGTIALNGTAPTLFVNGDATINAPLTGTAGIAKKGHRFLYLGGDNSGLSGSLDVHGFPNGVNAGVLLASNTAIGGMTTVNVLGNATYGGFFGLSGGVTLGSGVTVNVNSTGGASAAAPAGAIRSYGPGTINTIEGPVNVTLTGTRISNNDATRLDITGKLEATAGAEVVFRNAVNEGIHLTNTLNAWTGITTHSGGTLWAEPGALPSTSRLVLAASDPGVFQTKGTFNRTVGTGAGQVAWQNVPGGARAAGFSARGGDLAINLGGAATDLTFYNFVTPTGTTNATTTITAVTTTGLTTGMNITGTGIPTGATITAIGTNQITISAAATASGTGVTLSCSANNDARINTNTLWLNGAQADGKLTLANPINLNNFPRTIQVSANTAELTGGIKSTGNITKSGNGMLLVSGPTTMPAARTITVSAGTMELSGGLAAGNFLLTKSGAALLVLSGASTWSGGLTNSNSGIVRVSHNEGLGAPGDAKSIQMRGTNRATSILELSGGVTIPANKTLNISGKSFYATTEATIGNQSSMRNLSGDNQWLGSVIIAEGGGSYGIESVSGTLTLGADASTSSQITNIAANTDRPMFFFGAGNFILNNKIADGATVDFDTGVVHSGSGLLSITRSDNNFDMIPNLWSGTTQVVKMADSGTDSSLGVAASFNLGGTLRYTGTGDSSNRPLGLLQKGGTIESNGSGPLELTATSMSHQAGSTAQTGSPMALGATVLTLDNSASLAIGQVVAGTGIATGTTITAVDPANRQITINTATTAASTNGVALTFSGAANLDRTLTLGGTNTGDNLFAANLTDASANGQLGITKTGAGKWILSGATKTNTGLIDVQAGTLGFKNSLPPSFAPTVSATATLSLDNLTLSGEPALNIDGTLALTGPVKFVLPPSVIVPDNFTVLGYGAVSGLGNLSTDYRNAAFTDDGTSASLTVSAGIPLTWTGDGGSSWDVDTTVSWKDAADAPETFFWADSVTFGEAGALVQPSVILSGELRPASVAVNSTTDYTFGGTGTLTGPFTLTKSGSSTLTISGSHSFTGGISIAEGTLKPGNNQALGANGQIVNIASGATLDINGALTANRDYEAVIIGSGAGAGAIINTGIDNTTGLGSITLSGNATIGGTGRWDLRPVTAGTTEVDLAGFTLTKTGSNIIALVDGSMIATGSIDINEGTLAISRMIVSGTGSINANSGATLRFENYNTGSFAKSIGVNNGTVNLTGSNLTADSAVTLSNTGTFDIASTRTLTLTQAVGGTGGLTKTTAGVLLLPEPSTYDGLTSIVGGTLQVGTQNTLGALAGGAVTIESGAILRINRPDTAYSASISQISGAGTLAIGQTAAAVAPSNTWESLITLTGSNAAFTGNVAIDSGALKIANGASLGTGPKTVQLTNGTAGRPQLQLDGSSGDITIASDIGFLTSSQNLSHPAIGNLAGNNVIQGNITLTTGGGNTAISVIGGSLALDGSIATNTSNRTLILGGNSGAPGTINGLISNGTNPLALTVAGSNTWTFTEDNTYTGVTNVNSGTLLVNGDQSTATGNVNVASTATLGGTGSIGGAVTVNNGGTLAPGSSGIESLATGALTIATGATIAIDINTNTATADQLIVTGNVDLTGTADLAINDLGSDAVLPPGTKLVLADYSGIWDDTDIVHINGNPVANETTVVIGANTFKVDYSDDSLGGTAMTLTVPGGGTPYTSWADSFSLTGGNRAPSADPDNDGLENAIEFVIGANPTTHTPVENRPAATIIGSNLVFTFKRSDESEAFDVFVEHGTTLATWPGQIAIPVVDTEGPPVDVADNGPTTLDDVTVTIPMGTDPSKFARLKADIPYIP